MRYLGRVSRAVAGAALLAVGVHGSSVDASIGDILSEFLYYEEELKIKNPGRPVAEILSSVGERYVGLVDTAGEVRVWDLETGRQIAVEGSRSSRAKAIFPNARSANLIVAEADGGVYETAGLSFSRKGAVLEAGSAADAIAVSSAGPIVVGAAGTTLRVYNLSTGERFEVAVKSAAPGSISALAVSADGRFVACRTQNSLSVFDLDARVSFPVELMPDAEKVEFYFDSQGRLGLAQLARGGRVVLFRLDGSEFRQAGTHTASGGASKVWIRSDQEIYWARAGKVYRGRLGARDEQLIYQSKDAIEHVSVVSATDNVLIYERSGTFRIYSSRLGRVVAAGISTENGWAVIDANKRYDGSDAGNEDIVWAIENMDLELSKFSRQFHEPGLLLHYVGRAQLEFVAPGSTSKIPLPPRIEDLQLLENVAGSGRTVVYATAHNVKAEIADIEMYHNGKKVRAGAKIVDERKAQDDLRVRSIAYEIEPAPGLNVVAVIGIGDLGIEGPAQELSFERGGRASNRLHLVSVGIDEYADPGLKLGYARNDAASISELMRKAGGFNEVRVTALFDADASRERILAALREAAGATRPDDVMMIYLAGHGIALGDGWYFLSPAVREASEQEIVAKSVSAEQIATVLREASARHVVLMIDACNSGAVVDDLKGLLQYRVYNRLSREAGLVVLAASRRDQLAFERQTLGHGVFTAAMMSALLGEADRNRDRRVTARELVAYASRQIPTLAIEHLNEIQIPVAYAPREDFVLRVLQ